MTPLLGPAFPDGHYEEEIRAAYGDPEDFLKDDDSRDHDYDWRVEILSPKVMFPSPVRYSGTKKLISGVCVHKRLERSIRAVLDELRAKNLWRFVTDCAGAYNFRQIRGGTALSLHSWAAAIDLNAEKYPLGKKPDEKDGFVALVVPVFTAHGWTWGGRWGRPDAQHLQATKGA